MGEITTTEDLPEAPSGEAPVAARPRTNPIAVKPIIDAAQLKRDVTFSMVDLSKAMIEQASLYVHYAMLVAQASRQVDNLELKLEATESQVGKQIRNQAAISGEKLTEGAIAGQVRLHPTVIAHRIAYNEAKQIETLCKGAVKAFEQRRDMLIQMGASERKDRDGELRTMARRPAVAA